MSLATIVLAALVGLSPGDDPQSLVAKLGASRYADREAAAEALRGMGRAALAALREARDDRDPEIQARASALVEEIEVSLMVQPTRVRLDFHDRPIAEVARSLGDQAGVTLNLIPENNPAWNTRRITLVESEPVPFWQALDDLGRLAQVEVSPGVQMTGMGGQGHRQAILNLMSVTTPPGPSDVSGPFRAVVNKLDYHRARVFNHNGAPGFAGMVIQNGAVVPPVAPRIPPRDHQGRALPGTATESFLIELQLMAEPRMMIAQEGPPQITEAIDEKGHSLTALSQGNQIQHVAAYNGLNPAGATSLQLSLPLDMPATPGSSIKRLKVTVPVVVMARKDEPLVVPLSEKNKTFQNSQGSIQVHEVKKDPNQPFSTIELTVKLTESDPQQPFRPGFAAEMIMFRNHPGNPQNQVEIVDAQGRPFPQWFAFNAQPGQDGTRLTLRLMQTNPNALGDPAEIRFYEMARASTEVAFELTDIPMP